jgi:hypothetical protein
MDQKNSMTSWIISIYSNIQFTVETEKDCHLSLLVTDIYRTLDSSLGV